MAYQSICNKYGPVPMTAALCVMLASAANVGISDYSPSSLALYFGNATGFFLAGGPGHMAGASLARFKKMGLTEGGKLVRRFQAAAYAIPVSAGIVGAIVLPGEPEKNNEPLNEPSPAKVEMDKTAPASKYPHLALMA